MIKSDPKDWVEFVIERFIYNHKTGTVHWKSIYADDGLGGLISTSKHGEGYRTTYISGQNRLLHRVVWILLSGALPVGEIDHIDGDRTNNLACNLRDVSPSENYHNKVAKGYTRNKRDSNWRAQIKINKANIFLGNFETEEEARAAYEAAKKLYGFIHR